MLCHTAESRSTMAYSILIVDEQPVVVARMAQPLQRAGYAVTGTTTFEAAKYRLATNPPDLLIAATKLGLFNGLHLIVRGRLDCPRMTSILTATLSDPLLEAEATSYGAACVVEPQTETEVLALVTRTFASKPM